MTAVTIEPREAARLWIAETLTKHLHPDLLPDGAEERIRQVAAAVEAESFERDIPIEMAISLAVEWCDEQNREAGL